MRLGGVGVAFLGCMLSYFSTQTQPWAPPCRAGQHGPSATARTITTPGSGPSQSWKGSGAIGGCCRSLHRWLQVQRYTWLITKGLQSSDERSSPFLSKLTRQKAQDRKEMAIDENLGLKSQQALK